MSMLRRIVGLAGGTARRAAPGPALLQRPTGDRRAAALVSLLEASDAQISGALARHGAARSYRAVIVTTRSDVRDFIAAGLTFEVLPRPDHVARHAGAGDWPGFLAERWRLIHSKWQPVWIASYGLNFDQYLSEIEKSGNYSGNCA